MPSKRKLAPVVGRDGINSSSSWEQEASIVEIDSTFGRVLGLTEGQKVIHSTTELSALSLTRSGWHVSAPRPSGCAYNQHRAIDFGRLGE